MYSDNNFTDKNDLFAKQEDDYSMPDHMEEECGVFGIYSSSVKPLGHLVMYGLFALQHRGQESVGVTVNNRGEFDHTRRLGLVSDTLKAEELYKKQGHAAIGHVRYSTTGSTIVENAQPLVNHCKIGFVGLAHNGNLVNHGSIQQDLENEGVTFSSSIDSEVIIKLIIKNLHLGLEQAIKAACLYIRGAFALVILIDNKLVGIRDPHGIRPLILGQTREGDYVLASESCAIDAIDGEIIGDIRAGEMVIIDDEGVHRDFYSTNKTFSPCSFEYVYFARPDSKIDGINVYQQRIEAGKMMALQDKDRDFHIDVVIGVPDSGIHAAIGYAQQSNVPYSVGLIKSKYIGRTFILPTQSLRQQTVRLKLNPLRDVVQGKSILIVDDSLVRGTTAKILISLLRSAGAKEVHFRSASPKVINSCYFGIDTANREQLIASHMTTQEISDFIGADSLDFLELDRMIETLGEKCKNCCTGCFTGKYPINVIDDRLNLSNVKQID